MQSYSAITVEHVDIENQPISLSQLALSFYHPYEKSEFAVEALFPTLRGYNPMAGDFNPAAEE